MIEIKNLDKEDVQKLYDAFKSVRWNKPIALFENYLNEQDYKERDVKVAYYNGVVAGYGTLKWKSDYKYFSERGIPEINDLNILPSFRNKGIATLIIDNFESQTAQKSSEIGIGFGLYKDYGAAQSLYIKRGYLPNKEGITYNYENVVPGQSYCVNDDLVLWFTKTLKNSYTQLSFSCECKARQEPSLAIMGGESIPRHCHSRVSVSEHGNPVRKFCITGSPSVTDEDDIVERGGRG